MHPGSDPNDDRDADPHRGVGTLAIGGVLVVGMVVLGLGPVIGHATLVTTPATSNGPFGAPTDVSLGTLSSYTAAGSPPNEFPTHAIVPSQEFRGNGPIIDDGATTDSSTNPARTDGTETTDTRTDGAGNIPADWWYSPRHPHRNETVTFIVSYTALRQGVTYSWDLDDDGIYEKQGEMIAYRFTESGEHTVTLKATGSGNRTNTSSKTLTVGTTRVNTSGLSGDGGPTFHLSPTNPQPGETVTLFADPIVSWTAIDTYRWDLDGDGDTDATGEVVTYTFPTDGVVSVELVLERSNGTTVTTRDTIAVGNATARSEDDGTDEETTTDDEGDDDTGDEDTTTDDEDETTDEDTTTDDEDETTDDDTTTDDEDETTGDGTTSDDETTGAETTTDGPDEVQTTTDEPPTTSPSTTTESPPLPGFDLAVALVAIGLVVILVRRRDGE